LSFDFFSSLLNDLARFRAMINREICASIMAAEEILAPASPDIRLLDDYADAYS
jgi:hypothetical protein